MSDILEEVLNDQNEEKRLRFFKKLLPIVITISIIVIIIMFINSRYQDRKIKDNQKNGDIFVKAIGAQVIQGNKNFAFDTLENLINNSDSRIKEIALLEQVAIKISQKDYLEAKILLEKIIQNKEYHEITTAYARISWLTLVIDNSKVTDEDKEKIAIYLKHFSSEGKAFWATASIIKAIWDIKNNMLNSAEKSLRIVLAADNVSELSKDQARALIAVLGN
jgi:hypothetical protein